MTRIFVLILLLSKLLFVSCSTSDSKLKMPIDDTDSISLIKREGNFYEKGRKYGSILRADIQGQLDIWTKLCEEEVGLSLKDVYQLLTEKTGFLSAIEQHTPELLEEIYGMAEGAGVKVEDLLTLNLAEEIIIYFSKGYQSCTNIGFNTSKGNAIAYNLDLPDFLRQFKPVILNDAQQLVYGFPGIIATGGLNNNFAVSTNSLPDLTMDLKGLPLPFMLRKLLQCSTEREAIQTLKSIPLGAPQNIMIVGRKGIHNFECSANQKVLYEKNRNPIYHTNHAIVNTDFKDSTNQMDMICERFDYLEKMFSDSTFVYESSLQVLKQVIDNKESGIRSEETYLSFLAQYPSDSNLAPSVELLLPKSAKEATLLELN